MDEFNGLLFEGLTFDVDTGGAVPVAPAGRLAVPRPPRAHRGDRRRADGCVAVDEIALRRRLLAAAGRPGRPAGVRGAGLVAGARRPRRRAWTRSRPRCPSRCAPWPRCDGDGVDSPVFRRGSHKTLGEAVPRRFLEALARRRPSPRPGSGPAGARAAGREPGQPAHRARDGQPRLAPPVRPRDRADASTTSA